MQTRLAINVEPFEISVEKPWRLTDRKIRSFGNLRHGWRYGEGVPISTDVQNAAIALHHDALDFGFYNIDVAVGARNQIQIVIRSNNDLLEFTVEGHIAGDLEVEFYHEKNDEEVELVDGLTLQEARSRLKEFSQKRWTSSDSSTRMNFFLAKDDLLAPRSKTPLETGEYLLSAASASPIRSAQSANTSGLTIHMLPTIPQFFGDFYLTYSQKTVG